MARKSNKKHTAGTVVVAPTAAPVPDAPAAVSPAEIVLASPAVATPALQAQAPEPAVIKLGAHCSIKGVAALKQSLQAVVDLTDDVVIEADAVERLDTAAVQLLCAFVHQRASLSRKVVWRSGSPALADAARLLGVAALLALPADAPGVA